MKRGLAALKGYRRSSSCPDPWDCVPLVLLRFRQLLMVISVKHLSDAAECSQKIFHGKIYERSFALKKAIWVEEPTTTDSNVYIAPHS